MSERPEWEWERLRAVLGEREDREERIAATHGRVRQMTRGSKNSEKLMGVLFYAYMC